jgi:tripartite-type tricarboxylate transporter receptor subunit TctC
VNTQLPVKTVGEFIAYAKSNPGKLNYASAGSGSSTHLSIAYLLSTADLKVEHIPYKSNAEQTAALLAGTVHIVGMPNIAALPFAKDGRVRMLAVTSKRRSRFIPDLPTVAESGLPEYGYDAWFGLLGPVGMPRAFIDRVSSEMNKLIAAPAMTERLSRMGLEPFPLGPQPFEQLLREDHEKIARIVKLSGAKAD